MNSHSSCLPLTPVTPGRSGTDDGRKEEGGRRESAFVSVGQFRFRPVEVCKIAKQEISFKVYTFIFSIM